MTTSQQSVTAADALALCFDPPDVDEAHTKWGANCGPCALAAILHRRVMAVCPLFPDFARRRYVNPTQMRAALDAAGIAYRVLGQARPGYGLAFVQFRGEWDDAPATVQYRHTHWVGIADIVRPQAVYEVNNGYWVTRGDWEAVPDGAASYIGRHTPGGSGEWYIRSAYEISPAALTQARGAA